MVVRILLVDDSAGARSALRLFLELEGEFRVIGEAADGQIAVDLARELCPDVVLMDVRMPVMDGLAATQTIKHDRPDARVVLLSSADQHTLAEMANRVGAEAYLTKTMHPDDITRTIREVVHV